MERLEAKRVKGQTYYYYSHWARVDNRCRRVWQKYLANWKTSSRPAKGPGRPPFPPRCSSGDCRRHSGRKRSVPGSLGTLTAIAPNAARTDHRSVPGHRRDQPSDQPSRSHPCGLVLSNRSAATSPICFPVRLEFATFWDHMDAVKPKAATAIWKDLVKDVVDRERIDLSSICDDGTNFDTFIDTFNTHCSRPPEARTNKDVTTSGK